MILALLRKNDGLSSGRSWLRSIVKPLQSALTAAGFPLQPDGLFGSGTERVLKAFQTARGLPVSGIADKAVWEALAEHLDVVLKRRQTVIDELMPAFKGDLGWVHEQEGHRGRPYWPGGDSGVTLDPGVDLGHASSALVERLYKPLLSGQQWTALERVFRLKRQDAEQALKGDPVLSTIEISTDAADEFMPHAATPYWDGIIKRFSALAQPGALPSVQTVLLSLSYNRGPNNSDLAQLAGPLDSGDWIRVAERIGAMQQDHKLEGIRERRRREADLIRAELEYLDS